MNRRRPSAWAWRLPDEPGLAAVLGAGSGAKRAGHEPPEREDAAFGEIALDARTRRLRRRVRRVVATDRIEFALVISPEARQAGVAERTSAPSGAARQPRRRNPSLVIAPRLILVVTTSGAVTLCRGSVFGGPVRVLHQFDSTDVVGACNISSGRSSIEINHVRYRVQRIWTSELFRLDNTARHLRSILAIGEPEAAPD